MWLHHASFPDLVEQLWSEELPNEGSHMVKLALKLSKLKEELKFWNKFLFGNVSTNHASLKMELAQLEATLQVERDDDLLE